MKGLIIKSPHIERILLGVKRWEIRGSKTNIRGRIALIKSGSKTIVGYANLVDCGLLSKERFKETQRFHQANGYVKYKTMYFWELDSPEILEKPIPYKHPQGAIIWVNL